MWRDEWRKVEGFEVEARFEQRYRLTAGGADVEVSACSDVVHATFGGPGRVLRYRPVPTASGDEGHDDVTVYALAHATVRSRYTVRATAEHQGDAPLQERIREERDHTTAPAATFAAAETAELPAELLSALLGSPVQAAVVVPLAEGARGSLSLPDPPWQRQGPATGAWRTGDAWLERGRASVPDFAVAGTAPRTLAGSTSWTFPSPGSTVPLTGEGSRSWSIRPSVSGLVLEVWLNVFIAGDVAGSRPVPGTGAHAGARMIGGPVLSECFLTDSRGFSDDRTASSRVRLTLTYDLTADRARHVAETGLTHELDCETGEVVGTGRAGTSRIRVDPMATVAPGRRWQQRFRIAAADPLVLLAAVGGDVDARGTVRVERTDDDHVVVDVEGFVDAFPSYEAYARLTRDGRSSATVPLFRASPAASAGPFSLIGGASTPVRGRAVLPLP
ncbi:hypothetical protein AB6N23_10590 [Cellulomonas sp. 179-A 9B4 NHS]|uniref:hypothetical protein n=1 Tax=Cellulomonas sp. 179-A 9B4 NHS TaxID=3142379 RepID=UPI00399F06A9